MRKVSPATSGSGGTEGEGGMRRQYSGLCELLFVFVCLFFVVFIGTYIIITLID